MAWHLSLLHGQLYAFADFCNILGRMWERIMVAQKEELFSSKKKVFSAILGCYFRWVLFFDYSSCIRNHPTFIIFFPIFAICEDSSCLLRWERACEEVFHEKWHPKKEKKNLGKKRLCRRNNLEINYARNSKILLTQVVKNGPFFFAVESHSIFCGFFIEETCKRSIWPFPKLAKPSSCLLLRIFPPPNTKILLNWTFNALQKVVPFVKGWVLT